jgi:hypothetical protein
VQPNRQDLLQQKGVLSYLFWPTILRPCGATLTSRQVRVGLSWASDSSFPGGVAVLPLHSHRQVAIVAVISIRKRPPLIRKVKVSRMSLSRTAPSFRYHELE